MKPGVSIIVGCFMQEQYLEKAYWSAKNQIYDGPIDVVVNHDGCTACRPGTSASRARNYAIKRLALHDWIICLDADDMLPNNYVDALMHDDANAQGHWFAGCPVQFISGKDLARFCNVPSGMYSMGDFDRTKILPIPAAALFPKAGWAAVGGYDEELTSMEDIHFWYKLLAEGHVYDHTKDTCLLKANDGQGKVHRTPEATRKKTIELMNMQFGLSLTVPKVVR